MRQKTHHFLALLLLSAILSACSARQAEMAQRLDTADAEIRGEQEALRKELASLHLRQQLQADRLRRAEEELVRLRAEMVAGERSADLNRRSESPQPATDPTAMGAAPTAAAFDAAAVYARARGHYGERRYEAAATAFGSILAEAPNSPEADNAQYWIGECLYGAGRYRESLAAFNKVFAYAETEKDDDAQLKIARCHLALGQKTEAVAAFRKLLADFPDSEYVDAARRELRYLGE